MPNFTFYPLVLPDARNHLKWVRKNRTKSRPGFVVEYHHC